MYIEWRGYLSIFDGVVLLVSLEFCSSIVRRVMCKIQY